MAIAFHGTAALFSQFDPSHLLEGDGKFKFGVGAYLTSRYETAALYAGKTGSKVRYVYTVEVVIGEVLASADVHPAIHLPRVRRDNLTVHRGG